MKSAMVTKVVIAEDDDMVRELLVHILRDGGYEVHAACDGREALGMIANCRPIWCSRTSECPSSMAGARRGDEAGAPRGPSRVHHGVGATLDPEEVQQAGASLVLAKPFRYEEVLKQVAQVLRS